MTLGFVVFCCLLQTVIAFFSHRENTELRKQLEEKKDRLVRYETMQRKYEATVNRLIEGYCKTMRERQEFEDEVLACRLYLGGRG